MSGAILEKSNELCRFSTVATLAKGSLDKIWFIEISSISCRKFCRAVANDCWNVFPFLTWKQSKSFQEKPCFRNGAWSTSLMKRTELADMSIKILAGSDPTTNVFGGAPKVLSTVSHEEVQCVVRVPVDRSLLPGGCFNLRCPHFQSKEFQRVTLVSHLIRKALHGQRPQS